MRWEFRIPLTLLLLVSIYVPRAAAAVDWAPVTDAEKNIKTNPLDPGAGAVVLFKRGDIKVLERTSLDWRTTVTTYERIKIFTEAGRDAANISLDTAKDVRLSSIEGRTILPSGQVIPLDTSQVFHGKAYQEGKSFAIVKTSFALPSAEAGAIIEFETVENVDSLFPPPWVFDTAELGTLQSTLTILFGSRMTMSYLPIETTQAKISFSQKPNAQGLEWDYAVQNLHPIVKEPFALSFRSQAAMVIFTPVRILFEGQTYPIIGSWDDVAAYASKELKGMEENSKETKNKAKELAGKSEDVRSRAEAIYKYLQQNVTSSNLVGFGLGRKADEVLSSKRGDPDEINAVYVMMLKEAKVDADVVLVAAQNWQPLTRQFPNISQFSRAVTRVNFKDGAVFADPADPSAPFGDLPWFERGLVGLAVKGNKLLDAAIAEKSPEDNVSATKVSVQVHSDWSLEGDAEVNVKGAEAIDLRDSLLDDPPDKVEEHLKDELTYWHGDAEVSNLTHPDLRDSSQPFVLKAKLQAKLSDTSGPGELLLNPWLGDRYNRPVFKSNERHSAVRFYYPEERNATTTWQLPPEIKVESLPKEVHLASDLGSFSHSCTQSGNTVTCTRNYVLKKLSLGDMNEYLGAKNFFDEIAKHDQEVICSSRAVKLASLGA